MGASIPDVLQPDAFRSFEKTQGPVVMLLSASGQRLMRQLALHEPVVCRDGLLDDWEIGTRVGRNQTTVMRICDRRMQEGATDRRGRSHPPQCTTSREDR
ncbi:hypothetical protein TNCV_3388341 [Trichonephila clavipes]|nr:hypothetical protein TNCV_3388341 [Trichonephila clavipes]